MNSNTGVKPKAKQGQPAQPSPIQQQQHSEVSYFLNKLVTMSQSFKQLGGGRVAVQSNGSTLSWSGQRTGKSYEGFG